MNRLTDKDFLMIYSKVPRLCIDLIIETGKGILYTKRSISPYNGKWHLPGGTVLFNETLEHAAKRISKRELGVAVKNLRQLGVIEYPNEGKTKRHTVAVVFSAKIESRKINLNKEAKEVIFFKKIPKNTVADQKKFIKKHVSK